MQHKDELDQILKREFGNFRKEIEAEKLRLTPEKVLAYYKATKVTKKQKIVSFRFLQNRSFQIAAPIAALAFIIVSFGVWKYQNLPNDQVSLLEKSEPDKNRVEKSSKKNKRKRHTVHRSRNQRL